MKKFPVGLKVAATIIPLSIISYTILQYMIVSDFQKNAYTLVEKNTQMLGQSIFQSVRNTMSSGDPKEVENAIVSANKIEGVQKLVIYKNKNVEDLFKIKNTHIPSTRVKDVFRAQQESSLITNDDNGHRLSFLKPMIAKNECLKCHVNSTLNETLGVMELEYSFDEIDSSIHRKFILSGFMHKYSISR